MEPAPADDTRADAVPDGSVPTDRRYRHRGAIAIVGTALLAVAAVVVIFAIGIRYAPDYPTVTEQPEPPVEGWLAYVRWDENPEAGSVGPCVKVQTILGEPRDVLCGERSGGAGWAEVPVLPVWMGADDEGHLLMAVYEGDAIRLITYDVDIDEVVGEETLPAETLPPDVTTREDGTRVGTTWNEDGWAELWVRDPGGDVEVILRDRGPDGYAFWNAQWSMRGDHVLVVDSEQRTILVSASGDPDPRVLVSDAHQVVWYQPA